jgi:DNA-binding transcriptional MerR regulator
MKASNSSIEQNWKMRTVKKLADLSGVSVRALHHYDETKLLKPAYRTDSGYRLYGYEEYLRLQQILFYRELGVSLDEIKKILDSPDFDLKKSLEKHRSELFKKKDHLLSLISTVDKTLKMLSEGNMITEEELYEGFDKSEIESLKKEVNEKYDPKLVGESETRMKNMSREKWTEIKSDSDAFTKELAELMDRDPADPEVQKLISRHHQWIENFYSCNADVYRGLGELYVTDDRFRATYDRYKTGLADFMKKAMQLYAENL